MNARTLGLACLLAAVAAAPAAAQAPPVRISLSVEWRGEAPVRMFLDRSNAPPLALTPNGAAFTAELETAAGVNDGYLRAEYPDGEETALRIRLVPFAPAVPVTFFRAPPAACVNGVVAPLEGRTTQIRANLEAYFKARDLARDRASTPCGSLMRKRVAHAWFNRAYALAVGADYIAFDEDAAENLRRVDPGAEADIRRYLQQIEGRRFGLAYRVQSWAQRQGDAVLALTVVEDLDRRYAEDADVRAAAKLQGIDRDRLEDDLTFLRAIAPAAEPVVSEPSIADAAAPTSIEGPR